MISLDIIIPTYRLQSEYLIAIVQMEIPIEANVRFLIISDNPDGKIPDDFLLFVDNEKVILIKNRENYGVSHTRNIGIDNSTAEWILFLDDDVKPPKDLLMNYILAIKERPNEVGFFGEVLFPAPVNSFTKGICAGDILGGFSIGKYRKHSKCAPTANVLVKRSAIGDVRFLEIYDKKGACEEADFFLRIYGNTKQELQCLNNTPVYHDWWNRGKRSYERFVRINGGAAILMEKFPEYAFYTFPNIIECLFIGLPVILVSCFYIDNFLPLICVLIGIIAGEIAIEFLRLLKNKGFSASKYIIEVVLVRAAIDFGRLRQQVKQLTISKGFSKRWDFYCDGKNNNYQRFWAGLKFGTYFLIFLALYTLLK